MKMRKVLLFLLFLLSIHIRAQNLTEEEKSNILSIVMQKLEKYYPFPDISEKTIKSLKIQLLNRYYDKYNSPGNFAAQVTNSLEQFSNDKHLDLLYDPELSKILSKGTTKDIDYTGQEAQTEIWNNYGFKELKILDGNIGYLNLSVLFSVNYAGRVADFAMGYFANCKALIIDLRQNGGGWGDMVDYLLGYLTDHKEPLLLNISQSTLDSSKYSEVIPSYVPGKKLIGIPIYILTSSVTASAAEAFISHLKYFNKNVVIVGKKTKGAENPVEHIAIDNVFVLQIPAWKRIYSKNPHTWEGVGISPDVETEANDALKKAHINILEELIKTSNMKADIEKYRWALEGITAGYTGINVKMIKKYAGKYGKIKITYTDSKLYYQSGENPSSIMLPISDDYFVIEGIDYFRIRFVRYENSIIMKQIFTYGTEKEYLKTE
jgi:hypothetical protein